MAYPIKYIENKYAAIKIHFEWKSCIAHAVKIGLGSDQYKLITI